MKTRDFFQPDYVFDSIYDVDYDNLKNKGIKYLFFDIDNTLIPYYENCLSIDNLKLFEKLSNIGFLIGIISNNNHSRINQIDNQYLSYKLARINKPLISKFKKWIDVNHIDLSKIVIIGDQIVTDIAFSKKLGITSVLVKTIDMKKQKWYTKINRLREKKIVETFDEDIKQQIKEWYQW